MVTATIHTAEAIPDEEELVRRARELIPMLRERADAIEKARAVPREVIEAFREAGFFRMLQPARWGGYEMNPVAFYRVLMELGRGCCNSGWVMMILGIHQWEFGHLDPRACDDVWAQDPQVRTASSYAPFGTAQRVPGGYLLNGKWGTSSGCDHADWAFIGGRIFEGEVPVDHRAFLVPAKDYRKVDDWYVFGLAGTGSKSLVLENVFVPEYRSHSIVDYRLSDRGAMYLFPFNMIFFTAVSAVIVGFAQGAIDVYTEQMKARQNIMGPAGATAASPYVKDRLGNAVARVRAARMRLLQMMAETTRYVSRRELIPLADRVHYMLDMARVGRECEEAVLLLYKASSARGIFLSNPLQRVLRDTLAAANHVTQNADDNAGILGGYLLGHELPPLSYGL